MIKLSKKGGYAIKAVIYIAKNSNLVKIFDISKNEKIPEAMLRRIISDLEKTEIIETIKGRNGGVKLKKKTNEISVYNILNSIGEELGITDCTKGIFCEKKEDCSTTNLLGNLQKGFNSLLKIHTIDKIMRK